MALRAEKSVVVLGRALLRPGRFDRKVTLENPHRETRREILKGRVREGQG